MDEKKIKFIISNLGYILICMILKVIFTCLTLVSLITKPNLEIVKLISDIFHNVMNTIIFLCLIVMINPLIDFFQTFISKK